ncbi:MAG: protein translocase subunit SecF [Alphaproteobacteria bacterium]|jgi:protein-export membrane protein, SecD/SecF family|nr:protein translocase subunit SecF [Alphaproteobacteria bacterium]MBU0795142.1 protein translocase subunit SecF [Alphaproteobacteria bacterium]MBU0877266.1 protein translocase subunit SecF [Alphaproteobacteria bacterium]MBU1770584.1 protein translocase subunit SecF [Alphaproteobacteria bacterium]
MRLLKLVPDNTNIGFLKWRHIAMAISMLSIIASIALVATKGLNLGVDFVGGQMVRVTFSQPADLDELRGTISAVVQGDANIQQFGSPNDVSIRTPLPEGGEEAANEAAERLKAAILKAHPDAVFGSVDTVSGKVSGELFETGAWAMFFAMLAISIYIWFRFEWQFGLGALFALFHDVALTFGLFALTQMEFNLNIVAALLTIIGYSLNDTIVIYDRIRENLRKYRKMELVPLLDLSINETLARTVMTSLTIIITLVVLLVLGPEVIFGFTAAMLFGIFVGTYSSMYMSAPLLVWTKVGSDSFIAKSGGPVPGAERVMQNETMPR